MAATVAVGALAAGDVIEAGITGVATEMYRLMSIKCAWSITDVGAAIDDGFEFGVAHSDYTAAQIEEALEATTSMDLGDKLAQEKANRLVRLIGTISGGVTTAAGGLAFNDGRPIKTRLNWKMTTGDTLVGWVRNASGVIYTTGALLSVIGDLWLKDSV